MLTSASDYNFLLHTLKYAHLDRHLSIAIVLIQYLVQLGYLVDHFSIAVAHFLTSFFAFANYVCATCKQNMLAQTNNYAVFFFHPSESVVKPVDLLW